MLAGEDRGRPAEQEQRSKTGQDQPAASSPLKALSCSGGGQRTKRCPGQDGRGRRVVGVLVGVVVGVGVRGRRRSGRDHGRMGGFCHLGYPVVVRGLPLLVADLGDAGKSERLSWRV